jgi:hypothetical protein
MAIAIKKMEMVKTIAMTKIVDSDSHLFLSILFLVVLQIESNPAMTT